MNKHRLIHNEPFNNTNYEIHTKYYIDLKSLKNIYIINMQYIFLNK